MIRRIKIKKISPNLPKRSKKKKIRKLTLRTKQLKRKKARWRKFWLSIPNQVMVEDRVLTQEQITKRRILSRKHWSKLNKWNFCLVLYLHSQEREHSSLLRDLTHRWTSQMVTRKVLSGNLSNKSCKGLTSVIENSHRLKKLLLCSSEVSVSTTQAYFNSWRKLLKFSFQTATWK